MQKKSLKILQLSFDWRNIYEKDHEFFLSKLKRDKLGPDINKFFTISWSDKSYYKKIGNTESVHIKSVLSQSRIICDLMSLILVPYVVFKHKLKPDVFLVYDFPLVLSGLFLKPLFKTKIAFFLTNLPTNLVKTRRFSFVRRAYHKITEKISKRLVDVYFVVDESTRRYLVSLGIEEDKIKRIVLNLDEHMDKINASEKGKIREKFNIPQDKKIMLCVARLEKEKGFDVLLKSFAKLKREDLALVIAGDGKLKDELKNLVKNLNIENKVIFAGWIQKDDIWNYYKDADLFIMLSKSDALAFVFWEAMFMKVPVIGTRIGGIEDVIGKKEERGYFWDLKDIKELNDKIQKCIDDKSKAKKAFLYVSEIMKDQRTINDYIK